MAWAAGSGLNGLKARGNETVDEVWGEWNQSVTLNVCITQKRWNTVAERSDAGDHRGGNPKRRNGRFQVSLYEP